jgi:hypothetical protein
MGDQYKVGQAGAVGPGAHAHHMRFQQIWQEGGGGLDLKVLAEELSQLRAALKQEPTSPEQDSAIGAVAAAEVAARKGDGPGAPERLADAGKWAFDVATKIGVGVATVALKTALEL